MAAADGVNMVATGRVIQVGAQRALRTPSAAPAVARDGDIEGSEFSENGAGDGYSHNLYVGAILKLRVTGSYFHHARIGHRLAPASQLIGKGVAPGAANGIDLTPRREYVHPRQTRALRGGALHPGAAQRTGPAH